ncbi:MAG TPA: hypothetical protein VJ719_13930 [Chthoniobacterales bacterium]|nr:hypothetical protein [Chthoniobacterales bacterium]
MDDSSQRPVKISVHGAGVGAPTPEQVEKRAREIALIDERDPNDFTDADWDQARRELLGDTLPSAPEETEQAARMQEDWEMTPDDRGHRVNRSGADGDEESVGEHLVTEGVDEAVHDQMLEARKEELEQEGGII